MSSDGGGFRLVNSPIRLAKTTRSAEHVKTLKYAMQNLQATSEELGWNPHMEETMKNGKDANTRYMGLKSARVRNMPEFRTLQIFKRFNHKENEYTIYIAKVQG